MNFLASAAVCVVACLSASTVIAQQNLGAFVSDPNNGATALQRNSGLAVQRTCGQLVSEGFSRQSVPSPGRDLYLRCNELVQTALELTDGSTTRSLGYTDSAQLLAAVQQVSGEELSAQGQLATRVSTGQFSNIAGRLNALRFGTFAAAAGGRVASLGTAPLGGGASADNRIDNPFGWFTEGNYGWGDHDLTANEDGFDFDQSSATVGADYNFGSAVAGVSVGYDSYGADFDTNALVSGGNVDVDGVSGSLFGAWFAGPFTLNAITTYGKLDTDVTRRVVYSSNNVDPTCECSGENRTLTGSPDGSNFSTGASGAYDFSLAGWSLASTLSLAYRHVDIDGYDETDLTGGGLALRFDEQTIESLRSVLALDVSRAFSRGFGVLTPSAQLEWHHEFRDDSRTLRAKYVFEDSLPNGSSPNDFGCSISCFSFPSDRPEQNYGIIGVGLAATFTRRIQAYAHYEALVGVSDLSSNALSIGIRGQF